MKVARAVARMLKQEGVEFLIGYPVNPIIEACAEESIRTIIVRQERTGLHMCDAVSRTTSGDKIGVFAMQHGPGTENAFGGIAQAYGDSVPLVVLPAGYARDRAGVPPNFSSLANFTHITKSVEQVTVPEETPHAIRRAFTQARNGRPGPCVVELPTDVLQAELEKMPAYRNAPRTRSAPDPDAVAEAADRLVAARRPVIYAGQGVHYARAWPELRKLAELLEAPVTTSLEGKSAFPEDHPLALGSGGNAIPEAVHVFLGKADLVLGIGASFTTTNFGIAWPRYLGRPTLIQSTIDTLDIGKCHPVDVALIGDAKLVLAALVSAVRRRIKAPRGRGDAVARQIARVHERWTKVWRAKHDAAGEPINPYRVLRDLHRTVDPARTIVTHDAGSPRDQMSPFWTCTEPLSYIGWGKTTQLGAGLGFAMGAKLANPDRLCVNWWGDAAIGFTGMDFETAVRERIPILSVLSNNFSMAIELKVMATATRKYRSTDISGNYAEFAQALGGYGERITRVEDIVPAIERGIEQTEKGVPALLEFITSKEVEVSKF
ncbi:MAG: thiamine pyrophosphate-requiring protein [Ectothiorhodospiraceae bacterium]|nr:thiamine pyrophosphate-requiring protein [Chromatiales bacterium]MCP5154869.1 thiamine pyrophosphate-requiring protein [Ectothiorhodospiraceae bacterium]